MTLVTALVLLPLAGALTLGLVPAGERRGAASLGVVFSAIAFAFTIAMAFRLDRSDGALQMVDRHTWIDGIALEWHLGVDGISVWMLVLTAGLFLLAFVAIAFRMPQGNPRALVALLLMAEFGLLGVFAAADLVLFYVFWEAMLVPFALIVWMWGGARRGPATMVFVVYTMIGSLLMLVAIVSAGFLARGVDGDLTFAIADLAGHDWTSTQSTWLFAAFALAFLIKLPVFPFHGWMPGVYAAAPLVVTALLSAVMSKAGAYGLLRIAVPVFPVGAERLALTIGILAVAGIVYGSLMAWRARSMRMLVAYSSLAHLGFIVLGIMSFSTMAGQGAVLQMVNHGIVTAAAFAIVGILARARRGSEELDHISGLAKGAPVLTVVFLVVAMAALAIPGSNASVGEFFILSGVFPKYPVLVLIALLGVAYAAVYMLRMYQSTMNGPLYGNAEAAELKRRDVAYLLPLLAAMALIALWPSVIVKSTKAPVQCATAAAESIGQVAPGTDVPRTVPKSIDYLGCR